MHKLDFKRKQKKGLKHYFSWSNVYDPGNGEIRVTIEPVVIPMGWWTHLEVMRNNKARMG